MTHGSVFSGIGGFDLAAQWAGFENIFQVEIDNFCQKVLARNFPQVKRYKDIRKFDGTKYKGTIDVISGGFPCQPFSFAGKRKGAGDDRALWFEMFRVIKEAQPSWIIGENVVGIISMELDNYISDLEGEGYEVQAFIIPACAKDATHRRDRVWIVANSKSNGFNRMGNAENFWETCGEINPLDNDSQIIGKQEGWGTEPSVDRVVNGLPDGVDRLKGLGNAIVPQVATEIFRAIKAVDRSFKII